MKAYAKQVELFKVGECLVDLYESGEGQVAAVVVDPVTDSVQSVVWVSGGCGEPAVVSCDGSRLVLGARASR